MDGSHFIWARSPIVLVCLVAGLLLAGCSAPTSVEDPMTVLAATDALPGSHRRAMEQLDAEPDDPKYRESLHRMIYRNGYVPEVRRQAFARLEQWDETGLKRTIRQQLPRMEAWTWRAELCGMIADRGWSDLDPALVSSWAVPVVGVEDDMQRPEYRALAKMHGDDQVIDVVFTMFLEARSVAEQGLRARCWDLLHRLGQRERLAALLADGTASPDDAMLIDLRAGARELGIVPRNREEILWLRTLREPSRSAFWNEAVAAMATLPPERRLELELRDLPVVVAAARHEPTLLSRDAPALLAKLEQRLAGAKHHHQQSDQNAFTEGRRELLREQRHLVKWGDLAAMLLALQAMSVPQVQSHLFDFARRDREDTSTEYGGVLALDAEGRYEVLEFPPQYREHDQKYVASQAMMDAAYTSLFHFHFHVQKTRNSEYAGPALGDVTYADSTRANCLVFTSINENTLNMDYYRHGRVVIDLGEVARPGS